LINILVVEDDPVSMHKIKHDLNSISYQLYLVSDSIEALNIFTQVKKLNLIITDIQLPFGSGVDLIRDIRQLDKKIPIIVVSGTLDRETIKLIKKYNCSDILVKPYNKTRLHEVIHKLID